MNATTASPDSGADTPQGCSVPPEGWWCSREPGHEGPCAARPMGQMYVIHQWWGQLREDVRAKLSIADLHRLSKALHPSPEVLANRQEQGK